MVGCGSDSDNDINTDGNVLGSAPSYLVSTGVLDPDNVTGLIFGLDSLATDAIADRAQALVGAFVIEFPELPDFIVVGQGAPEPTRYVDGEEDSLSEGDTVLFANFGITPGFE